MKKFHLALFILFLNLTANVSAQNALTFVYNGAPLKIGDKVPDYTLQNLINYPAKNVKLSEFKGRLLILDFWATWCTWCVASIPKMEALQEKYKNEIQIILVNENEIESTINDFLVKRELLTKKRITLPITYGDTVITNVLFKHLAIPHLVWIDPNGIIRYFTKTSEVNETTINAILNNKEVTISQIEKRSPELSDEISRFFFNDKGSQYINNVLWQSTLYPKKKGFPHNAMLRAYENGFRGVSVSNFSIVDMLRFAFGQVQTSKDGSQYIDKMPTTHTSLKSIDSISYGITYNNFKQSDDLYCYQLIAPLHTPIEKVQEAMQLDIERYFGFRAKKTRVKVQCLVLSCRDTSLISYQSGDFKKKVTETNLILNKITIPYFIQSMAELIPLGLRYLPPYPIVDETGFRGRLGEIRIETNIGDYKALDDALQKYGMRLKLEVRELEMLVIQRSEHF